MGRFPWNRSERCVIRRGLRRELNAPPGWSLESIDFSRVFGAGRSQRWVWPTDQRKGAGLRGKGDTPMPLRTFVLPRCTCRAASYLYIG